VGSKIGSDRYATLAERQAARWERARQAKAHPAKPAVALSRLPGSGGEEVARLVAERLDFGLFGREIVEQVAEDLGVDHWLVDGLDEHVHSAIERSLSNLFGRNSVDEDRFQRSVARAVTTLGRRGSVVIVGRGAPFLLSEHDALRVLLVAPREQRAKRYAEVKALEAGHAESELGLAERQRADFARRHFGADLSDPARYDLSLNTGTLGFEGAADLIVEAYRRRFPG